MVVLHAITLIIMLCFMLKFLWYNIPNAFSFSKCYVLSSPPSAATTILVAAQALNGLCNLSDLTDLNALMVSKESDQFRLNELLNMHERLNTSINDAYREINSKLNSHNNIDTRIAARDAANNPFLAKVEDKHSTILSMIKEMHKNNITVERSFNEGKLRLTRADLGLSYTAKACKSRNYMHDMLNLGIND